MVFFVSGKILISPVKLTAAKRVIVSVTLQRYGIQWLEAATVGVL